MKDDKKKHTSHKRDKNSSPSTEKGKFKPVNKKFTKERNADFKKSSKAPRFLGTEKDVDNSRQRNYKQDSNKTDGERRPFNRGPRRDGGEGSGERKPFSRGPRREGGEGSGERKPFNRGPRREGGEGSGERRPFSRGPRREGGEGSGERKPFSRGLRREGGEGSGERRPFSRGPRRESGEGSGERKPFNRGPRREGGEGSGERRPFSRGPRREGGEGSGERRPFSRGPRREGGEGSGERRPFSRGPRREEREDLSYDGEELLDAPPEKREVRRYQINPDELKMKSFPKSERKFKVRKDKEEGILQGKEDEKRALLEKLKEDSILGTERNFSEGAEQTVYRINRFLAKSGLGARRDVEDYIRTGQITVNGEIETSLSKKIDVQKDTVEFNGEKVELISDNTILALNKPAGYLCSHHDVHHDKTVFNLLPLKFRKFNMAGRLDLTSRGLMIFSANGDVLNQISHPSYDVKKRYLVQVDKPIQESDFVETFLKGIEDDGEFLRAKETRLIDSESPIISIMLKEGKKRQIHRMFQAIGFKVVDLQRVQIGKLLLDDLDISEGKFKEVKLEDIFG